MFPMFDNVKCNNCDFKGSVPLGTEKCPCCGYVGGLAWVDGEDQEVEDDGK